MTSFIIVWESLLQDLIDNKKFGKVTSLDMLGNSYYFPLVIVFLEFLLNI